MARSVSFSSWGNRLYTGETSYDFVGRRWLWYGIAAAVVALSIAALLIRGLNLGIEFTGGSEFRVSGAGADASELAAFDAVGGVNDEVDVRANIVGGDSVRVQTSDLTPQETDAVRIALADTYGVSPDTDVAASFVGPTWGEEISQRALTGLLVFLGLVSLAITAYFRTWKMAVAALVALLHDLVVTVGVYAAVGFEVSPASVIGFLTILGYSLYDTVVVFDKVRENTTDVLDTDRRSFAEAANLAVNQTLVRSINTSVVALLPVSSILFIGSFLLGAGTLQDLALALFVGIAAGTYSSVFIATPLLVHLRTREREVAAQARRVAARQATATQPGTRPRAAADAGEAAARPADEPGVLLVREDGDGTDEDGDAADRTGSQQVGAQPSAGTPDGGPATGSRPAARRPPMRPSSGGQRPQPKRGRRR